MKNKSTLSLSSMFSLKWILILATVLRLAFLNSNPISLNWDEVSMGYSAYSLAETGKDEWGETLPIFFRSYGEWKSAVYIYFVVPFVKVLGLNAWAVRLPSALAGIAAVYLVYLLVKQLYNSKVGLFAALFMAITPWHLVLSRPAFEANLSLTLVILGIYGFVRAWQSRWHYSGLALSLIGFGLAPHTYNSSKIVVPFIIIYLIIVTSFYRQLQKLLVYFVVLGFFALPIILNMFSGVSQHRYTQVGVTTDQTSLTAFYAVRDTLPFPSTVNKLIINKGTFFIYKVADNWFSYLNPAFLFIEAGDHKQHHVPYRGILYLTEAVFLLFGLIALFQKRSILYTLPIVLIVLGFLPGALTRDTEHVLRSILAIPGFIILLALGANYLTLQKPQYLPALYLLLTLEFLIFCFSYFIWYPKFTARDWQFGHQEVATYLKANENKYEEIIMTKWFGEPQLFLAFYNQWDPTWYQTENQKLIKYETEGKLWLDQLEEYRFGKYTFRYLNWHKEDKLSSKLYIGKWDDFYIDSNYQATIKYPDGTVAFQLVEGEL